MMAQVLASIGQLEFFYDQAPDVMRSCSMALQLLSVAVGSYLSGAVVAAVGAVTAKLGYCGGQGWLPKDMNYGRLDLFFLLLAGGHTPQPCTRQHYRGAPAWSPGENLDRLLVGAAVLMLVNLGLFWFVASRYRYKDVVHVHRRGPARRSRPRAGQAETARVRPKVVCTALFCFSRQQAAWFHY